MSDSAKRTAWRNRGIRAGAILFGFAAFLWAALPSRRPIIPVHPVSVAERFRTTAPHGETDSLAVYRGIAGQASLLLATDKHRDRLQVFDAATGESLHDLGTHGDQPGQFRRPNGVAVWQGETRNSKLETRKPDADAQTAQAASEPATLSSRPSNISGQPPEAILFVVERDAARVQAFALPEITPLCLFGQGELRKPYGVAVQSDGTGRPVVFITDNSRSPDQRVRRYDWRPQAGRAAFTCTRAFGDTSGPGVLRLVESIAADPQRRRLYICDEHHQSRNVKTYSDDGAFLGITFADGYVTDDPEGIALWPDGSAGWIVLTNQGKQLSTFHLFDRASLRHVGAFVGKPPVANTDGVALSAGTLGSLAGGGFYAVDDDGVVAAYGLDDIRNAAGMAASRPAAAGMAQDKPVSEIGTRPQGVCGRRKKSAP